MDPQRLLAAGDAEGVETADDDAGGASPLPFLTDRSLTAAQLQELLQQSEDEKEVLQLTSQIVTFAPWDDIWNFISPEELEQRLPDLDLAPTLTVAWESWLRRSDVG